MAANKILSDMVPFAPEGIRGEEVTVIIRLPDGMELETTGTFESAEWTHDWTQLPPAVGDTNYHYESGEKHFTLRLKQLKDEVKRIK